MHLLNGGRIAAHIRAELTVAIAASSIRPHLSSVRVGDDPASAMYLRAKERACAEVGITCSRHDFPGTVATEALVGRIRSLNDDASVHGILVQLPLPHAIETDGVIAAVDPAKDVDGFHPQNLAALERGERERMPVLVRTVFALLREAKTDIVGRRVVLVSRNDVFTRPFRTVFGQRGAVFQESYEPDADATSQADVLISALGRAHCIGRGHVRPGAVVLDVGITPSAKGPVGDVDAHALADVPGWLTPVPGGVGPVTVAMLLVNTVLAASVPLPESLTTV